MSDGIKFTKFQSKVLALPAQANLFLGGGRGGGKSTLIAQLAAEHMGQYGKDAHSLYIRQSHAGTTDFASIARGIFTSIYGTKYGFNAQTGILTLPSTATLEINQLEGPDAYRKFQGRSFTQLLLDEAGHYPDPTELDKLRSNLRGPSHIAIRTVIAANPGDPGHGWIYKRYARQIPWVPFAEPNTGAIFISCPSKLDYNPHINKQAYYQQLQAACANDPELLRAWTTGDWDIARGAFFGSVWDSQQNVVPNWQGRIPRDWPAPYLSMDWGSDAPCVCYVVIKSPGAYGPDGQYYPRNSIILLDEFASYQPDNLAKGMGYTVDVVADRVKEMCRSWTPPVRPEGVIDDSAYAQHGHEVGSIATELQRNGIALVPAKKGDRIGGWVLLSQMMDAAGKPDVPGFFITTRCEFFLQTVPFLARDPRKREDVDSRGIDHAADAARYSLTRELREAHMTSMW